MKKTRKLLVGALSVAMIATAGKYIYSSRSASSHKPIHTVTLRSPSRNIQQVNLSTELKSIPAKVYYRNKVVIVTFHDVEPTAYSPYVITPAQFSEDIRAIQARFHVLSNHEFINFLDHNGSVPPNSVLLTFDDGYRGMYTYALPILLAHHMQGTFFEIVGTADKQEVDYLNWPEITAMVHDGMVVESHTYNSHYEVHSLKGKMEPVFDTRMVINGKPESLVHYDMRVYKDFSRARMELMVRTGEPVDQFAWPFGWGTTESESLAKWAGYQYIYTTTDGYVGENTNHYRIPRIDIGKPWISPSMALQLIIHFSNVQVPNSVGPLNHQVTEVNITVKRSKHKQGMTKTTAGKTVGKKDLTKTGAAASTHPNSTGSNSGAHTSTGTQGTNGTTTTNGSTTASGTVKNGTNHSAPPKTAAASL